MCIRFDYPYEISMTTPFMIQGLHLCIKWSKSTFNPRYFKVNPCFAFDDSSSEHFDIAESEFHIKSFSIDVIELLRLFLKLFVLICI